MEILNEKNLSLYRPKLDELWYREKLLGDRATMEYNKRCNLGFPEYDNETGCIEFPKEKWQNWYNYFIGNEPERFYAYIVCCDDGKFIGEVNLHRNGDNNNYDMGIVIENTYRGKGYAGEALSLLIEYGFEKLGANSIHNDFEQSRIAALRTHLSAGFKEIGCKNGIVELGITREQYYLNKAIRNMTSEISSILSDCSPSVYLYGSVTLNDFRLGWSDIDILCLTQKPISKNQAERLVNLRQRLLDSEPDNPYYRSFEGGILTLNSFLNAQTDRVVYWGTSGENIADSYRFDSFSMAELLDSGMLIYGNDVRKEMQYPTYEMLKCDVSRHYETIRKYAVDVGKSIKSFGWLLDIARCIYTLRTGKIIAKTTAGEWAIDIGVCPVPDALEKAVQVRINPRKYSSNEDFMSYTERLGSDIQRFADVLKKELR